MLLLFSYDVTALVGELLPVSFFSIFFLKYFGFLNGGDCDSSNDFRMLFSVGLTIPLEKEVDISGSTFSFGG